MNKTIQSSKESKSKISKKQSFKLSKNLLKTLTTNQLLLLLPTIVNKIIRDNKIQLADDSSNQTEMSMLSSEECCKSSEINLKVNKKNFRLFTQSNIDKSKRSWFSLPIISNNCKTISADNLIFKNESTKTFESLFNDIASSSNRSPSNTLKQLRKFTKKWTKRNQKKFPINKKNVNTNCQKKYPIPEKPDGTGTLTQPTVALCKSEDRIVPKSKLIYEINEISIIEFEEYIEIMNSEKFNFINTFLNKSYEKLSPDSLKSYSFFYGELNKISELVQYRINKTNSHSDFPITKYNDKNQLTECTNHLQASRSLEVKVDVCEDQLLKLKEENTSAKSLESLDSTMNNFPNIVYNDSNFENSITNEFESNYIIKVSGLVDNSTNKSFNLLSTTNHELENNQMGYTSIFEIENIDILRSIKSITKKLKSIKIRKIMSDYVKVHRIQIHFPIVKKLRDDKKFLKNISDSEQKSLQKQFSLNIDSTSTMQKKIPVQHLTKNRRSLKIEKFGLSTSKIVNGRFQHGWNCTYKNCMIFNSLKNKTCKNCLNLRWCHPPLSKRDIYCVNCGYINYKSRLYCKKCKVDFIKQKDK